MNVRQKTQKQKQNLKNLDVDSSLSLASLRLVMLTSDVSNMAEERKSAYFSSFWGPKKLMFLGVMSMSPAHFMAYVK